MAAAAPGADLAAVLAGLALAALPADARRDGADVVFVDSTRAPLAVHAADRARLARASVFFAGLFAAADGGDACEAPGAAAVAVFAVGQAGGTQDTPGLRRLPLPAPGAFHHLLPYLDSGELAALRALAALGLSCDDYCALLANASFLGVGAAAIDVLVADLLAPLWPRLADAAGFRPDTVSPDALELLLRELARRDAVDGLAAAQTVLRWAHRGGWGGAQSALLRQLLDTVAPLASLSAEAMCALAQTAVSRELLDVALPAAAAREHMAALAAQLASARSRIVELTPVWCSNCQRHVRAEEYACREARMCDRPGHHTGTYQNSYGWSCCGERKKRAPGCGSGYYHHFDPPLAPVDDGAQ
jgi:hypothetical protein